MPWRHRQPSNVSAPIKISWGQKLRIEVRLLITSRLNLRHNNSGVSAFPATMTSICLYTQYRTTRVTHFRIINAQLSPLKQPRHLYTNQYFRGYFFAFHESSLFPLAKFDVYTPIVYLARSSGSKNSWFVKAQMRLIKFTLLISFPAAAGRYHSWPSQ
jgi:hypothetical protein